MGLLGGGDDFLLAGIEATIGDVISHKAMQKTAVLLHQSDLAAQTVLGNCPDILPVNCDAAAFGPIKPLEKFQERGFSRAGASDNCDFFPGIYGKADFV